MPAKYSGPARRKERPLRLTSGRWDGGREEARVPTEALMDDIESRLRACVENDDMPGFKAIVDEYGMEQAGKFWDLIGSGNISTEELPGVMEDRKREGRALTARWWKMWDRKDESRSKQPGRPPSADDSLEPPKTLQEAMGVMVNSDYSAWGEFHKRILRQYPLLLSDECEDVLRNEIMKTPAEGVRAHGGMVRLRLARCRQLGLDEAFAEEWEFRTRPMPGKDGRDEVIRLWMKANEIKDKKDLLSLLGQNPPLVSFIGGMYNDSHLKAIIETVVDAAPAAGFEVEYAAVKYLDGRKNQAGVKGLLIQICEEMLGRLPGGECEHFRAHIQYVLGSAYLEGGEFGPASQCYMEALDFYTEDKPIDHVVVLLHLGHAFQQLGDPYRGHAVACFEKALGSCSLKYSPWNYAKLNHFLGELYFQVAADDVEQTFESAAAHFVEAVKGYKARGEGRLGGWPYGTMDCLRGLGKCYIAHGLWEPAWQATAEAVGISENIYEGPVGIESVRNEHMLRYAPLYRQAAYCAGLAGRVDEALSILERGKARLLKDALNLRAPRPANIPNDLWEAYRTAADRVQDFKLKLFLDGTAEQSPGLPEVIDQMAKAEQRRLDQAVERIRRHAPYFQKSIESSDVADLLPDESTALLMFCVADQGSIGVIICKGHAPRVVNLFGFGQPQLNDLLVKRVEGETLPSGWVLQYAIEDQLDDPAGRAFEVWNLNFEAVLGTLSEYLLLPVLAELPEQIKKLILVPSSTLSPFPLHAAPLELKEGGRATRVCDLYQVSYAPSLGVLANCRARISGEPLPSLLAVINPSEDSKLIYSQLEGEAVAALFDDATVYEGPDATASAVSEGSRGRSHLHFSCHGAHDWTEASSSVLFLADKALAAGDLMTGTIDLAGVRLVTLSACETGITNIIKSSADEFQGLPAGFILAGAPCVVSSLWSVPDLSTAILMEHFYVYHLREKMSLPAALAEAQRSTREMTATAVADYADKYYARAVGEARARLLADKNYYRHRAAEEPEWRPFAAPYYWAAFTAHGL